MEIFLHDDALIAQRERLELRTARVRKHAANPVVVLDRPWEMGRFNYTCVIGDREEGLYKMWYQMIVSNPGDNKSRCHYAVSQDGIRWEKPALGLVEFEGSKENNIVFEELEGIRGTPSYWVYKDYAEVDPGKRYKMMLQSWGFQGRASKMAYSPDGVHWTMSEYGNLPGPFDSQNDFFWDERIGQYVGYFRSHVRATAAYRVPPAPTVSTGRVPPRCTRSTTVTRQPGTFTFRVFISTARHATPTSC